MASPEITGLSREELHALLDRMSLLAAEAIPAKPTLEDDLKSLVVRCSHLHEELFFAGKVCPACLVIQHLEEKLASAENQIASLHGTIDSLEAQLSAACMQ